MFSYLHVVNSFTQISSIWCICIKKSEVESWFKSFFLVAVCECNVLPSSEGTMNKKMFQKQLQGTWTPWVLITWLGYSDWVNLTGLDVLPYALTKCSIIHRVKQIIDLRNAFISTLTMNTTINVLVKQYKKWSLYDIHPCSFSMQLPQRYGGPCRGNKVCKKNHWHGRLGRIWIGRHELDRICVGCICFSILFLSLLVMGNSHRCCMNANSICEY